MSFENLFPTFGPNLTVLTMSVYNGFDFYENNHLFENWNFFTYFYSFFCNFRLSSIGFISKVHNCYDQPSSTVHLICSKKYVFPTGFHQRHLSFSDRETLSRPMCWKYTCLVTTMVLKPILYGFKLCYCFYNNIIISKSVLSSSPVQVCFDVFLYRWKVNVLIET